jgi:hypothetical protein
MRVLRAAAVALGVAAQCLSAPAQPVPDAAAGAAIYRQGLLPDGQLLQGRREAGVAVQGGEAACVNCHRRSGFGTTEGRIRIPPITGKYLFRSSQQVVQDVDAPHVAGLTARRDAYTPETLLRALREGIGADGRMLNYLMPRYALDDRAAAALLGYLKTLSSGPVPGVGEDTLHFATIFTPDADPAVRRGVLDVMERFFADKNEFLRGGVRRLQSSKDIAYRVTRRWQLHVWDLSGPPESWEQQLDARLASEPVFAVVSGLGGKTWAPVHRFCERRGVPCLFPNIELAPAEADRDFYSIYFSKGVLLEADLAAARIQAERASRGVRRVVQVYAEQDIGAAAAQALGAALRAQGIESVAVPLRPPFTAAALAAALRGLRDSDALMLWLRPQQAALLPRDYPNAAMVLMSGLMAGLEKAPLHPAWKQYVQLVHPYDVAELRRVRMNFPLGWFRIKGIPVVDERVQTDTYLACGILAETLGEMLDSFVRDYLVESVESMLSRRPNNGYYPRLSLAPGQRFASKGGYVVQFAEGGERLQPVTSWMVP